MKLTSTQKRLLARCGVSERTALALYGSVKAGATLYRIGRRPWLLTTADDSRTVRRSTVHGCCMAGLLDEAEAPGRDVEMVALHPDDAAEYAERQAAVSFRCRACEDYYGEDHDYCDDGINHRTATAHAERQAAVSLYNDGGVR